MNAGSVVAIGLFLCTSCGGESRQRAAGTHPADASQPDASPPDAGNGAQGGACASAPLPLQHRAVAETCPTERGSSGPIDTTTCADRSGITCSSDADCTAGKNGRCVLNGDPCQTLCSYDACLVDADCAAGPCVCRSGAGDVAANICLPGSDCRTDADCGECKYCSLSVVPNSVDCMPMGACSCGDGVASERYACRTASDDCATASDCPENSDVYCAYDDGFRRWRCGACMDGQHP
jgi:hypothetical protein